MEKKSISLKSHLELCRRLGIRYVSMGPQEAVSENQASVAGTPTASTEPEQARQGRVSETSALITGVKPKWVFASPDSIQAMELTAFDRDIQDCQKCSLAQTRKNFVFGSGNPQAQVMFVGEAPGGDEDAQGLPFVGAAGQLLTKIIESTKVWKRPDVFICNVLKCRPPKNRTPLPEEVEQCLPHLEEQIRIIRPKLIMAMGASAAQTLLKTTDGVGKLRNQWHDYEGIPLRVTYHPAALLRFDGYKRDVWEDMKEFTKKYLELSKG